jgi:hypothetical protein
MDKIKLNIGGVILELDKEEASKAIEAGELVVNSNDMVVYKKDEFETYKTNISNEEYKKGKTAGVEMTIKDAREKYALDFEGKSFDNFAEAFKNKILTEAKVEPSKKIQELEADKNKLLQNYQNLEGEFNTFKTGIQEKEVKQKKDNTILSFIPKEGLKVGSDIALMALRSRGVDVAFDEGGNAIPTINGEPVKDQKTLQPVALNSFISEQITGLGLLEKPAGGTGGGDEPGGGKATDYEKFVKEMEANGIDRGSEKFNQEMNKRLSDKTLRI